MRALISLILVLLAALGGAQSPADALRGTSKPIEAKDLPESYRAVTLGGGESPLGGLGLMGLGMGMDSRSAEAAQSTVLFALMGVTFVDPDEFTELLEGKRPRIRGYALDFPGMILASRGGGNPTAAPTFAETWIEAGRVPQWSPRTSLTRDLILKTFADASKPRPASDETRGLANVKQVALGMLLYAGDYDDTFPKADSTAAAQKVVAPYLKNDALWNSPNGGRVLYNTALSAVTQTSIEDVAGTLLVWEEKPYADGWRAVGYTDGHAKRLSAEEWASLWLAELKRRKTRHGSTIQAAAVSATRPAAPARRP